MAYKKSRAYNAPKEEEEKKEEVMAEEPEVSTLSTDAEPAPAANVEVSTPDSSTDKTEDKPEKEPTDPGEGGEEETPGEEGTTSKVKTNWAQVCCAMTQYPGMA